MSRRLFFVPEVRRGTAELTGHEAEHLVRVLRAQPGEIYEISDNRQKYLAKIESARKSAVVFQVLEELPPDPNRPSVHLYPALFKFDRFELLLEKATELGVTTVRPFESARSERGLRQAALKRAARWQRIVLEASQQSRRTIMPVLYPVVALDDVLRDRHDVSLMLDEGESRAQILAAFAKLAPEKRSTGEIALVVGPEGGWTTEEKVAMRSAGYQLCSLGSTILRAETAAIAALSVINAYLTLPEPEA
jgi:16S rRNA (uracil1498-N3)-methyltransferase